jgi:hypothetical protein
VLPAVRPLSFVISFTKCALNGPNGSPVPTLAIAGTLALSIVEHAHLVGDVASSNS